MKLFTKAASVSLSALTCRRKLPGHLEAAARLEIHDALLVIGVGRSHAAPMAEIAKFVHHGAAQITPKVLKGIHRKLPLLKLEFAQINAPKFPHLVEQLEFLADVVEDFAEGAAEDLPFVAVAAAAFALVYAHRQMDLIPNSIPEFGHADDSAVVRAVLIEHEKALGAHAMKIGIAWAKITVKA